MRKMSLVVLVLLMTLLCCCTDGAKADNNDTTAPEVSVYVPDEESIYSKATSQTDEDSQVQSSGLYYANTNTKKFHLDTCSSASRIKNENLYITDNREELISGGYTPCMICTP